MTNELDEIRPSGQNRVKTGEKVESLCNFITKFTYQVSENIHRPALTRGMRWALRIHPWSVPQNHNTLLDPKPV